MNTKNFLILLVGVFALGIFFSHFNFVLVLSIIVAAVSFWYLDKQYNITTIDNIVEQKIVELWNKIKNSN